MIATLLSLLGAIPGLGSILAKLGLTGAAYAKGRMDQSRAEELADARADLDAVQSRAESDDRVRDPGVVTELRRRHTRPE
jgi:hypothetical protein